MKSVRVSAPGKVHLMGEHAVVYGKPALLAAVDYRTTVLLSEDTVFHITSSEPNEYIRHAIEVVCSSLNKKIPRVHVTISSAIPSGFHLGSSAAVAVATVGAMYYFLTKKWNLKVINDLAYEVEKEIHGNPSGGDNTTVTYGGFLWFQKKSENKKVFKKLTFSIPDVLNHFFLINTGKPKESTGEMVAVVRSKIKDQKSEMETAFSTNEKQVKRILDALKTSDEETLIDAIRCGERTLEEMGVVSQKVTPLIRSIEKAGGAAKILGGGGVKEGVGFILCYHRNRKCFDRIASRFQYPIQRVTLGEEGLRRENK